MRHAAGGLNVSGLNIIEQVNYPLLIVASPGEELSVSVIYDSGRFEAETIDRLLSELEALLRGMLAKPEGQLFDLFSLLPHRVADVAVGPQHVYENDHFLF